MLNRFSGIKEEARSTIFPLMEGVIDDIQTLFRQELALARSEFKLEFDKAKTATLTFGAAVFVTVLSGVLGCLTLAYLLVWLFPTIPLWACFGITSILLAAVAIGLFVKSKQSRDSLNIVPKQTLKSLKETTQWATSKI
jgi:uncharacterized membrane protein YqjE